MPSVFRSAALVLVLTALAGCAASGPASGEAPEAPGAEEASWSASDLGSWSFTAMQGARVVSGTFEFGDESSHIDMPGFTTDSQVRDGRIGMRNDSLRWEGTLETVMGPSRFVIGGVRDGDAMSGFAEIEAAGTYQFEATRSR